MSECVVREENYDDLGGVYFPIRQQDGTRQLIKISSQITKTSTLFLGYLRRMDREPARGTEE